jgi:hypothetical protein
MEHGFEALVALLEPRVARNKRKLLVYALPAILSEATVFCVTGGHRG